MKEELLHFIWQSKMLLQQTLITTSGEPISIVQLGAYNRNAGPDFFNAKIKIGNTLWVGNVEMHVLSSEWNRHKHETDKAYNNVILHVVFHHDREVKNEQQQTLPVLELRSVIPTTLLSRYQQLQQYAHKHIACEKILIHPNTPTLNNWLQRLLVERIEQKCDYIHQLLTETNNHWEQCFYLITARYFGMKTNSQPFEQLARLLPLSVLAKHKNNLNAVVALVVGVAGLFSKMDAEIQQLESLYTHLKTKYNLQQLDVGIWKFARTRPANFPTERVLQFAALVYQSSHLFSKIVACNQYQQLQQLYTITVKLNSKKITIGKSSIDLLLINSVLPFVFIYGKLQHKEEYMEKALTWYEQLKPENNSIIKQFSQLGFEIKSAADAQAFIQLKNEYCTSLKCLHCAIGFQSLLHA